MGFTVIILIALSLSTDSFAVSLSNGMTIKKNSICYAFVIAASFGLFHGVMPFLGWFFEKSVSGYITGYDDWIVFGIILFFAVKMIYESFNSKKDNSKTSNTFNYKTILILSFATSIDAFAAGIRFSFLHVYIIYPVLILAFITFLLSFIGVCIGKKLGAILGKKVEIFGGFIMMMVAFEFILEHYHVVNIC